MSLAALDFTMSFLLLSDSECFFNDLLSEIFADEVPDVDGLGSCLESSFLFLSLFVDISGDVLGFEAMSFPALERVTITFLVG